MVLKTHTEDPNDCWCIPAVLLTPETRTVVHRLMLRDVAKVAWYERFGWPDALDPVLARTRAERHRPLPV